MTKTIYEVLYHDDRHPYAGAAGDGSFIERFTKEKDAVSFASSRHYCGKPASVSTVDLDTKGSLYKRWRREGKI